MLNNVVEVKSGVAVGSRIGGSEVAPISTSMTPGFRFHPTDEELLRYYLTKKIYGKPFRSEVITEIDVYAYEPWELGAFSSIKTRDMHWYFFCTVNKKYGIGSRVNRTTGQGFWKSTGKERSVRHKTHIIGMKKTLIFHDGRALNGKRTNWVMHEYRLADEELKGVGVVQDDFVLCRIFQKSGLGPCHTDMYAPFVDDDVVLLVPRDEPRDGDSNQDMNKSKSTLLLEYPIELSSRDFLGRTENADELELFGFKQNKRAKQDFHFLSLANGSEDSTNTTVLTNSPSTFFGVPSLGHLKNKEIQLVNHPCTFDSTNLEKYLPPGYITLISKLENDVLNDSMERDTLKIEVMGAQEIINDLQKKMDLLDKENKELIRSVRGC